MDGTEMVMETPPRKRPRSSTPSSSSSKHVNKRVCLNEPPAQSPFLTTRNSYPTNEQEELDTVLESDVPESPITQRKDHNTALSVSFAPHTPLGEISDPFAKLNLKTSAQKKSLATPVAQKPTTEGSKSVKKSARKTPGSAKTNKAQPFLIKSSTSSLIDHPLTVTPIATFPRLFFPIAWLIGCMPRVFSSHRREFIPSISGRDLIMIAKVEGEKNMVVVERVGEHVYSMCMLKKDLKVKDIRLVAKSAKETDVSNLARPRDESMQIDGEEWWRKLAVGNLISGEKKEVSLDFLIHGPESEQSVSLTFKADSRSSTDQMVDVDPSSISELSRHESEFSADSGYASSPQTALPSANSIKSQYLEALYSTKASLAYFAKSALARARAEFQQEGNSAQEDSLPICLQNLILSDDDFNSKYENYLPSLNQQDQRPSFPITEEERKHLIQKFKQRGGEDHEINESTLQREINDLKIRETQLQIIILAESLALHEECEASQEYLDQIKQEDYETLLSSHLDRLSISSLLGTETDFSEQFMREILLPFYGSRLPRILDLVDGPLDFVSPVKSRKPSQSHPKSISRQSILSPNTLDRISRPRRQDLSPSPFPIISSRKTFKSTPKKAKVSRHAGVLKRLQKTEISMRHTVPSKKVRKLGGKVGSTFGSQRTGKMEMETLGMGVDDGAMVQVPATPAPRKRVAL